MTGVLVVARPWDGGPVGEQVSRWLGGAVLVLLPGAVGIYVRTRAQLLAALRERAERAEAEQELLARDAVLTERTRIAREMHDAVGHRVSLMVLQAGAIEMAAADPARVEQLAGRCRPPAARRSTSCGRWSASCAPARPRTRRWPRSPASTPFPAWSTSPGRPAWPCELTGPPDGAHLDPAVSRAAYRIVQEALTNAGKHAPGRPVSVAVERPAGHLVVRVVNGPGHASSRPRAAVTGWWGWLSGCAPSAAG